MFVVSNELFVATENREVFERNFAASMHGTLTGIPGLIAARLMRPRETDRGYLSVLEFTDETAYSAFRASEAFAAAHNWPDHAPIDHARLTTYEVHTEIAAPNLS
ncbi:antibiotic biosynthesis monooxygenase [Nocardia sp. SYP-A9097]|uniref:antibiotic biosynthesis monooxygenase family protein n=1 Tax=Nocardia sp. SYP-A9097 TaxID=2663237 RepID=UPI00129A4C6E|nr:antibiotic biosynthesis monooxygenase [Nocardia sp. SYP-A9097]MRH86792.1 antibiotic biosynthesis monooxygenase [Nocardia sp. SYP-A9097]